MKKFLLLFLVAGWIIFFGCSKSLPDNPGCTPQPASTESAALLKFAADSGITATKDSSGMYYQILDPGSNVKPTNLSVVTVSYVVRLLNGALIDSSSSTNFSGYQVFNLIYAWQIGLPKIGVGGHIKLLAPSMYGYGCTGYQHVPPNAPLYFDIKLFDVK